MTGVRNSIDWTNSDALAEAVSAESCHIVLETSPPDYVKEISRFLETSVVPSRQDKACNEPAEADSDSGDSLFITQKPVLEPVRQGRRHRYAPASPGDVEENEDDSLSSGSLRESTSDKKKKRLKVSLPKYSFPFLKEQEWRHRSTLVSVQQNTRLHNATMGGFFQSVREMWQGYERGNVELSLPALDMDGQDISPLSEEEEEERSEDEDIRVVKKKHFLASSKAKCSQPWYTPEKTGDQVNWQRKRRMRRAGNASQEMLQESQRKMPRATLLFSDSDSSDDGDLTERKINDKSDTSILTQTETPKAKRLLTRGNKKILFLEKETEEDLCNDSDATVCEPPQLQESQREHTQAGREAAVTLTEAHADDMSQRAWEDDEPESQSLLQSLPQFVGSTNYESVWTESTVIKKKKKKNKGDCGSVEGGSGQNQGEPQGLHTAASDKVEAKETFSKTEVNRAKPPALQSCDEPENSSHDDNLLRQEEAGVPDLMPTKRKKSKFTAENVEQELGENLESGVRLEDSEFSVMCNMEIAEQKKKKKKKKKGMERSVEDNDGVEQLQFRTVVETLNDDAETQKKKKKEKRITEEHEEGDLENTEFSQETIGSSYEKKRRKHKTKKRSSSLDDTEAGQEDVVKVSWSNEGVTLEGSTGLSVKKKKREGFSEGVNIPYAADKSKKVKITDDSQKTGDGSEDQDAEQVTKKKKKKKRKKMTETSSRQISEDTVAQSGDALSVRKKEKKRTSSFLQADSEEKDAQPNQQQSSCLKSVAAHVWGVEKAVSDVEVESAERAGNSGDGVSKKKKKRKRKTSATLDNVEEVQGPDFEEPNKTCESVFTDTGVKRKKKKRKRSASESVTPLERLDSAVDEGKSQTGKAVTLKKKKNAL